MEPVKNLVVGEYALFFEVVYKPFVEGRDYGRESYLVASVCKNLFQAFNLFVTVGEDEYLIAIVNELRERVAYQVKIL